MSISSEIELLRTNLANSYAAAEEKGATLPQAQNFNNLAAAILSITTGGGDVGNIYTARLVKEMEDELYHSSLTRAGLITTDRILQDDETLTPLRNTWQYKPADMAEYYQEILTNDLLYAKLKLTEILGEINE